jgi:hypothetical protein
MVFTPEMERTYRAKLEEGERLLTQYKLGAEAQIPRMAQQIAGAEAEYNKQTQGIVNTIASLSTANKELKTLSEQMTEDIQSKESIIRKLKKEVHETSEVAEQERTLNMIRKEQAESLKRKYEGNYHSSWMGLYRPLKETSRFALLVVSILFFVIVLSILVYAYQKGFLQQFLQRIPTPEFLKKSAFE